MPAVIISVSPSGCTGSAPSACELSPNRSPAATGPFGRCPGGLTGLTASPSPPARSSFRCHGAGAAGATGGPPLHSMATVVAMSPQVRGGAGRFWAAQKWEPVGSWCLGKRLGERFQVPGRAWFTRRPKPRRQPGIGALILWQYLASLPLPPIVAGTPVACHMHPAAACPEQALRGRH